MFIAGEKRRWRPWSSEDDMVLKRLYAHSQISSLVQILNRSKETIRVRASFLNLKRSEQASSLQKSRGAIQRRDNADAAAYQPIDAEEDGAEEMSSEVFGQYKLLAIMKSNARALHVARLDWIANITNLIVEQISTAQPCKKLEFLTIHDGL